MARNTATSYRHRPAHLRLANFAGRRLGINSAIGLDAQRLCRTAVEQTGQDRVGSGDWLSRLDALCGALRAEAGLNLVGRLSARNHLLQLLRNRLLVADAIGRDLQIERQQIERPVFITGLPRTGSTLLHGLLSQDPKLTAPLTWEVMLAGEPPGNDATADRERIARTDALLRWVNRVAPRFRTIHPMGALLPQECIAITAHAFASVEFHTTFAVPSFQRELDASDPAPALDYHRRFVQYLQRYRQAHQWVFKAPAHLYALDAIRTVYPDARFVFTSRAPAEVIASIASHAAVLRCAFSDTVDPNALAREWLQWWAEGWLHGRRFRDRSDAEAVDLDYQALVADPIAAVGSLYEQLGWSFDRDAQQRMRRFLRDNARDKHGRHRYTLEQFGLSHDDVAAAFAV